MWFDALESRYQVGEGDFDLPKMPNADNALTIICWTNSGVRGELASCVEAAVEDPHWVGKNVELSSVGEESDVAAYA